MSERVKLTKNYPPGWLADDACPDCAGTGMRVNDTEYAPHGRLASVTFSLKNDCPTCRGTGRAAPR